MLARLISTQSKMYFPLKKLLGCFKGDFCNVKLSKTAFLTSFYDTYQIEMEIFIPYNKNYLFH